MKHLPYIFILLSYFAGYFAGYFVQQNRHQCPEPPIPTITYVQEYMAPRGYYSGEIDGIAGPLFMAGIGEMSKDDDWSTYDQYHIENTNNAGPMPE